MCHADNRCARLHSFFAAPISRLEAASAGNGEVLACSTTGPMVMFGTKRRPIELTNMRFLKNQRLRDD
jgi:hypothetical protein